MNPRVFIGPAIMLAMTVAAQAQPGKTAVIAFQQAIISTKDGQKAAQELQAKAGPKQKEIEGKQSEITNLQDKLSKGASTLSDSAKTELYKEIESRKKSLQRDIEDAQAELDQDQQRLLQQLGQKVMAVVEKYARDNGYTMVVDVGSQQSPVLYASPSIEITKEIIELYDKSSTAMSAPAAAPKPAAPGTPAAKPPATPPAKPPATGKQ